MGCSVGVSVIGTITVTITIFTLLPPPLLPQPPLPLQSDVYDLTKVPDVYDMIRYDPHGMKRYDMLCHGCSIAGACSISDVVECVMFVWYLMFVQYRKLA